MTGEAAQNTLWRQARALTWGALGIGLLLGLFSSAAEESWTPAVVFTLGTLAYAPVFLLLFRFVLPSVEATSTAGTIAAQAALSVVAMAVTSFVVINVVLIVQYGVWMFSQNASGEFVARDAWTAALLPILPTAGLAVTLYNQTWIPMRDLEIRARRADELAATAQLEALRAQINPHFLFNSLNSIAQLISTDPVRAEECVERLSEIFRYLLSSADRAFVTLADELDITDGYLDIERARFGDQLDVEVDVEPRARGWIVPTLIVQPLVENAVRHGLSRKIGGGRISIRARVENRELVVDIADTGVGMATNGTPDAASNGVGLRNVRERLTHLYGASYRPSISSRAGEGTHVRLRVPARPLEAGSRPGAED